MRVLRSWLLLVALLMGAGADAGDHNAEASASPSYLRAGGSTNHLGGWHISGALTWNKDERLSFAGELSTHFFGSDGDSDLTQVTFLAGLRWHLVGGKKLVGDKKFVVYRRFMPFVHFMALGAVHRSDGRLNVATSAGAFAYGGGLDFVLRKRGPVGIRVQVDYIDPIATDLKGSLRISVGWVYRFHESHS